MLNDFKKFLIKWNVVDMAVWFIFWAAFATVVKSLVTNIIMPPIWLLLWKVDFSNLFIALDWNSYKSLEELNNSWAAAIKYWLFINELVSFIILWFILFLMIKWITNLQKKEEVKKEEPKKSDEVLLLEEIRDSLKKK